MRRPLLGFLVLALVGCDDNGGTDAGVMADGGEDAGTMEMDAGFDAGGDAGLDAGGPVALASSTPAEGDALLPGPATLELTFTQPLDESTVSRNSVLVLGNGPDEASRGAETTRLTHTAGSATVSIDVLLEEGWTYRIVLRDIDGMDGTTIDPTVVTFRAQVIAPEEVAVNPGRTGEERSRYAWDGMNLAEEQLAAGSDGTFGTADDEVTQRTVFEYGADFQYDRVIAYSAAGDDDTWGTADDVIAEYDAYERDLNRLLTQVITYNAPGDDAEWLTEDDLIESASVITLDALGVETIQDRIPNLGPDGMLGTSDDVIGRRLERRYRSASADLLGEALSRDAGADGVWLTADDSWQAITSFVLGGATGSVERIRTFSDPGADGIPLNADDTQSSYIDLRLTDQLVDDGFDVYVFEGADGMWETDDDLLVAHTEVEHNADGYVIADHEFRMAGPDGMFGTPDDVLFGYELTERGSDNAPTSRTAFDDAGPDGMFETADDLIEIEFQLSAPR